MIDPSQASGHVWTVAEAKSRLSELLRRARAEGPQRIGTRAQYVVVSAEQWEALSQPRPSLGAWLIENMPHGAPLEQPDRSDPTRSIPFVDESAV